MDFDDLNALQQRLKQLLVLGVPKDQRSRKITLLDVGHAKAKVIQTLRDLFSLSLIEAKSLVDSTPSELPSVESEAPDIDAISRKIDEAVWTLECAGAQVHAEPSATWDVTPYDQDLFAFTPELALAPTWELIAQVYSGPKEGFGRLWPWLISSRPSWQAQTDLWRGRRPKQQHSIAEAVTGDQSMSSFMQASMLIREVDSLNGSLAQPDWHSHRLISAPSDDDWTWIQHAVNATTDMLPSVTRSPDGTTDVTFYTVSRHLEVRLVRHQDLYAPGSYHPKSSLLVCATGGRGYIH